MNGASAGLQLGEGFGRRAQGRRGFSVQGVKGWGLECGVWGSRFWAHTGFGFGELGQGSEVEG